MTIIFEYNSEKYGNPFRDIVGKDGHRQMMKIRLNKSRKSWIWDQYLPETMKSKIGNKTEKLRNF